MERLPAVIGWRVFSFRLGNHGHDWVLAVVTGPAARDVNSVGGHTLVDQGLDLALNFGESAQVGAIRQEGVGFVRLADLWGFGGVSRAIAGGIWPVALEHGGCAFRDRAPGALILYF